LAGRPGGSEAASETVHLFTHTLAPLTLRLGIESFPNLEHPHDKIERSIIKIILWTIGVIVLLVGGGILGHREYRNWQQRRLIAEADALVHQGDYKRASLGARRVLQINPDNAEACRIMARISEKAGLRSALEWRRRIMDLGAATQSDLIALARDGVRFDDRAITDLAMSRLPESAKTTAEYHVLLADIAQAQRNGVEMERELSEAQRLDPSNKDYAMRLAALRLVANDRSVRAKGRETLAELQKDPATRRDATRYLAEDAIQAGDFETGLALARELESLPGKSFLDRLVLLSALQAARDPGFAAFLEELQTTATEEPERVAALMTWMNLHKMAREAIVWGTKLPPAIMGGKLVQIALSDAYVTVADWPGLQRLVKAGNWGNVDFIRNALAARAWREMGNDAESAAQWNEAVRKVTANSRYILTLVETVQKWGWRGETIELLWLAAKDPVKGDEALRTLYRYFASIGDTQNLYRVLLHRAGDRPDDRDVQNNLAQLSLLLNLNADRGQKVARELYEKEPANAAYASTYAFSLYSQGEPKKALKVMEALTDQQLREPSIAAYYGIILAAAGEHARAREFLDLGEKASLLTEEKALLEKARRSLAQG
jgi:cytochrome c-type biogenesis protein CcmH/NrfG